MPRSTDLTDTALARSCDALAAEWASDARARRRLTPRDLAADTLDYCADALRAAVAQVAEAHVELTVAEYAALHGAKESTVRRWCATGALRARRSGRSWLIRRGEQPPAFGRDHAPVADDTPAAA